MRPVMFLCGILALAVLQVSSGVLRDPDGLLLLDPVLVAVVGIALVEGPWLGLACGLLGGVVCGLPGGVGAITAVVYGLSGLLASPWRAPLVAVTTTVLLALLHSGLAAAVPVLPESLRNAALVASIPWFLRLRRQLRTD